ncbi:hypothetical protein DENSPDRAFT_313295 [Dentipellis sp. KUC8613]|nr:hypothetical protein DENSPDRAFT_313295 [Dentipellis sp. KUC8613]
MRSELCGMLTVSASCIALRAPGKIPHNPDITRFIFTSFLRCTLDAGSRTRSTLRVSSSSCCHRDRGLVIRDNGFVTRLFPAFLLAPPLAPRHACPAHPPSNSRPPCYPAGRKGTNTGLRPALPFSTASRRRNDGRASVDRRS